MRLHFGKWLGRYFRSRHRGSDQCTQIDNGSVKTPKGLKRLLHDRRGGVTMVVTATMPIMVAFTGLGVDMASVYMQRRVLQDTASSAALAASSILPLSTAVTTTTVANKAIEYAQKNMPTSKYGNVLAAADVSIGTWDRTNRTFTATTTNATAVRVVLRRTGANSNPIQLFFSRLIGYSQLDVTATATATFGTAQAWDIAIVQDITASLTTTDMTQAKTADQSILSCVQQNFGTTSQASVMSFTGISGGNQLRRGMTAVGTSSNYTQLTNAVTGLDICSSSTGATYPCGGTNIAAGIEAGIAQFRGSYTPGASGANFAGKAIILVTDGAPNWSNAAVNNDGRTGHAAGDYGTPTTTSGITTYYGGLCTDPSSPSRLCSNSAVTTANRNLALANMATAQADSAWNTYGISVFTIYLDQGGTTAERDLVAGLIRGKGTFQTVSNSAALASAMFTICATVPRQLVD